MLDLAQLREITIIVVGDIILDVFYHGKVTRFTPDAPVPVIKIHNITRRLGGAANVANNLSSLGVNVVLSVMCEKYVPDSSVCATQVLAGCPQPWMVFRNMSS